MSGEASREQFAGCCNNNYNYVASFMQILLDTDTQKKSKHRKFVIGLGVGVIYFAFVLCIISLSSKSDRESNLVQRNDTDTGNNSSSTQKASNNAENHENRWFLSAFSAQRITQYLHVQ